MMSALLKPLVDSEVTDYVTGGEGGNILSQRLGGGARWAISDRTEIYPLEGFRFINLV